ncbi:RecX family transcriptional regulator [Microbacterium enclense]|uniref:Regulatory protein RecX n=2 Tax=Microbacterium enclense TaxID=993073 RepID=A0A3S3KTQ7_9MICO|nr:regulatory protein RecX [Microbacterium enclense]RWR14201.1 RecX family transcriptional regulator [Microbacterium enclense]
MTDDARRPGRDSAHAERDAGGRAAGDELAPVIPLFGSRTPAPATFAAKPFARTPAAVRPGEPAPEPDQAPGWSHPGAVFEGSAEPESPDEIRDRSEAVLLRKLRGRSLSLAEARTTLRAVEGVDDVVIEEVVTKFVDLGYLDDEAFAEQLAMSAVERRGQGRRAVVQTLRKRGIPRDVADAAIAELPDDDAERALEFARSKARSVGGKDYDASLRRLAGQLARRGYSSSVSLEAARQALAEAGVRRAPFSRPSASSGVRFTPDD